MKRIYIFLALLILIPALFPLTVTASDFKRTNIDSQTSTMESSKSNSLIIRLHEINAMDRSNLNRGEKRELRKEVLSINTQLHQLDGGIYLSVGAVIIIILLLILLL